MTNGSNTWDVSYPMIRFAEGLIGTHRNVASWTRERDIFFYVERRTQGGTLRVLVLDEYTMGLARVQQALAEFGHLDIIWSGGNWAGYTPQAKQFCLDAHIGLYNTGEVSGGLSIDDYWDYAKRDLKGNRIDCSRAA